MPGGEPDPHFIEHVKALIADPDAASTSAPPIAPSSATQTSAATTRASAPAKKSSAPLIVAMSIGGIIILVAMMIWAAKSSPRRDTTESLPTTTGSTLPATAIAAPVASDRLSIAVLPFANMSEDASANSFFADGIHEDLLTNLAFVPELKVVSRTSVMQYRDTTKPVKQIAGELGVGTLLEGSVRRFGNQVRVTAQLIDASTDEHIWAQNYDRKLEDIFAIQGELAQAITDALRIALTDEQIDAFAQRPTQNLEAYELFLKEQELADRDGNTEERQWQSIAMMQQAVELDPEFALAWANLGVLHAQAYFWERDMTERRRELATQAIERAIKLGPEDLDVMTYVGSYFYYAYRNYTKAAEFYQKVLDVAPNHIEALASLGFIRRREGRWADSIQYHERVMELDPRNIGVATGLTTTYSMLRQWSKAVNMQQILVDQAPGDIQREHQLALFKAQRDNSDRPLKIFVDRYPDLRTSTQSAFWDYRVRAAILARDWETALQEFKTPPDNQDPGYRFTEAIIHLINDQPAEGTQILLEILREAEDAVDQGRHFRLAFGHALLDQPEEAQRHAQNFIDELALVEDAMSESYGPANQLLVTIWGASPEDGIQLLKTYLSQPANQIFSRFDLRDNVWIHPLWEHPDFEALIDNDATWGPLFVEP